MSRRKTEGEDNRKRYGHDEEGHLTPKLNERDGAGRSRQRSSRGRSDSGRASRSRSERNSDDDSSLDRMSSSKATAKLGSDRKSTRLRDDDLKRDRDERDRDEVDLRSERSRGSRYEGVDKGRRSPGFGGENEEHDRLDTFGAGGREMPSKTTGDIRQGDRRDRPEEVKGDRRIPGTQYDKVSGTGRPPIGARGEREAKDNRDSKNYRDPRRAKDPRDERNARYNSRDNYNRKDSQYSRGRDSAQGSRGVSAPSDPRFNKIIDAKISKKAPRELDFSQSKAKREKDWMLDFKSHRPVNYIIDKMDQPVNETISYLLLLESLSNIPVDSIPALKEKGAKATLNYSLTLYDDKEREFIGRSYISRPIQLKSNFKETENKEFVFFHTTWKSDNLWSVVECFLEIVNVEQNNKMLYVSLGFNKFIMFGSKGIAVPAILPMYLGSPRLLILKSPLKDLVQNSWSLKIQIKEFPVLDLIKPLIPSTTLCGMHDFVPGIVGNKMKVSKKELQLWGYENLVVK